MMARAVPRQCVYAYCACGRPWSSRTTTVESNMKSEHNLYLACEDSSQRAFFFCTFSCFRLALLASTVPWLLFLKFCKPSAAFCTSWVWQTRTYVHCENSSLIQSLALMRSAIIASPCWFGLFPECLISECLIVKMSNPKMSNEVLIRSKKALTGLRVSITWDMKTMANGKKYWRCSKRNC